MDFTIGYYNRALEALHERVQTKSPDELKRDLLNLSEKERKLLVSLFHDQVFVHPNTIYQLTDKLSLAPEKSPHQSSQHSQVVLLLREVGLSLAKMLGREVQTANETFEELKDFLLRPEETQSSLTAELKKLEEKHANTVYLDPASRAHYERTKYILETKLASVSLYDEPKKREILQNLIADMTPEIQRARGLIYRKELSNQLLEKPYSEQIRFLETTYWSLEGLKKRVATAHSWQQERDQLKSILSDLPSVGGPHPTTGEPMTENQIEYMAQGIRNRISFLTSLLKKSQDFLSQDAEKIEAKMSVLLELIVNPSLLFIVPLPQSVDEASKREAELVAERASLIARLNSIS